MSAANRLLAAMAAILRRQLADADAAHRAFAHPDEPQHCECPACAEIRPLLEEYDRTASGEAKL